MSEADIFEFYYLHFGKPVWNPDAPTPHYRGYRTNIKSDLVLLASGSRWSTDLYRIVTERARHNPPQNRGDLA